MEISRYIQELGLFQWLGSWISVTVMVVTWVVLYHANWRGIIPNRQMLAATVLLTSLAFFETGLSFDTLWFAFAFAPFGALFGWYVVWLSTRIGRASTTQITRLSPWRFRAAYVAIAIGHIGVWTTFLNRGNPPLAPNSWHKSIVFIMLVLLAWSVAGLHLLLHKMLDGTGASWQRAFRVVMIVSASPAALGLVVTLYTGNRWLGFSLTLLSLLVLWVEVRCLERVFPDSPAGCAKSR